MQIISDTRHPNLSRGSWLSPVIELLDGPHRHRELGGEAGAFQVHTLLLPLEEIAVSFGPVTAKWEWLETTPDQAVEELLAYLDGGEEVVDAEFAE